MEAAASKKPLLKRRSVLYAALAVVIVAIGVGAYIYLGRGGESVNSIAVPPFINISGDPETEYLSDGIADGIANQNLEALPSFGDFVGPKPGSVPVDRPIFRGAGRISRR
jgi:hypothetical protein